jgi:glycerol kinase
MKDYAYYQGNTEIGCFMLKNIGNKPILSKNNLLTTVAWKIDGKTQYALEGSIFVAGSVVQWLRDGLGIIKASKDIEALAASVPDNGDVYFVPALTGLGAPYWDQYARGSIVGISRGTTSAHIARAALEGIAFQTMEVLRAMEEDDGVKIIELRVDGGASANKLLMQFQTDLLGIPVVRPQILETTALGAAYLAGLGVQFWTNLEELQSQWVPDIRFEPQRPLSVMEGTISKWKNAVQRSLNWINE